MLKVGDKITALVKDEPTKVLLVSGAGSTWNVRIYRERKISGALYPIKRLWLVVLEPNDENVWWARGWDSEAAGAFRAQRALQRSHE